MLSSSITNSLQSAVSGFNRFGGNNLPSGYIFRTGPDGIDSVGSSIRTLYPKQYLSGGSVTPPDGVTFVSNQGTGSINAAGVITGDIYDITDSAGNFYPFGSGNILFCTSGGANLVMSGVTCGTSNTFGSDWLNLYGLTVADGSQYPNEDIIDPIADGVAIPILSNLSGVAAYSYIEGDI